MSFGISSVAGFLFGVLSVFYPYQFISASTLWKNSYKEDILSTDTWLNNETSKYTCVYIEKHPSSFGYDWILPDYHPKKFRKSHHPLLSSPLQIRTTHPTIRHVKQRKKSQHLWRNHWLLNCSHKFRRTRNQWPTQFLPTSASRKDHTCIVHRLHEITTTLFPLRRSLQSRRANVQLLLTTWCPSFRKDTIVIDQRRSKGRNFAT